MKTISASLANQLTKIWSFDISLVLALSSCWAKSRIACDFKGMSPCNLMVMSAENHINRNHLHALSPTARLIIKSYGTGLSMNLGPYSLSDKMPHWQILVKSWNRNIGCCDDRTALKLDRLLGNAAAEVPFNFQSYWESLNPNLAASILHEIIRYWDVIKLTMIVLSGMHTSLYSRSYQTM